MSDYPQQPPKGLFSKGVSSQFSANQFTTANLFGFSNTPTVSSSSNTFAGIFNSDPSPNIFGGSQVKTDSLTISTNESNQYEAFKHKPSPLFGNAPHPSFSTSSVNEPSKSTPVPSIFGNTQVSNPFSQNTSSGAFISQAHSLFTTLSGDNMKNTFNNRRDVFKIKSPSNVSKGPVSTSIENPFSLISSSSSPKETFKANSNVSIFGGISNLRKDYLQDTINTQSESVKAKSSPGIFSKVSDVSSESANSFSSSGKVKETPVIFGGHSSNSGTSNFNLFGQKVSKTTNSQSPFGGSFQDAPRWPKTGVSVFSSKGKQVDSADVTGKALPKEVPFHFRPSQQDDYSYHPLNQSTFQNDSQDSFFTPSALEKKMPKTIDDMGLPPLFQKVKDLEQDYPKEVIPHHSRKFKRVDNEDNTSTLPTKRSRVPGSALFSHALGGVARSNLSSPLRLSIRRRLTSDSGRKSGDSRPLTEVSKIKSILCKNVSFEINKRDILSKHFSKYGRVVKLITHPSKNTAFVHFSTHEEAEKAKKHGSQIGRNHKPLQLFYGISSAKKKDKQRLQLPNKSNPSATPDEVSQEIAAMCEGNSFDSENELLSEEGKQPAHEDGVTHMRLPEPKQNLTVIKTKKSAEIEPLRSLLKRPAFTAGDKFAVLDARDKILRLEKNKIRDMNQAQAMKGTCPDMCPEKERYMREERRRLEVYEILVPGEKENPVADHYRCVKEYSRSSADQEEPLPHELRPVPVLTKTMNFLLSQVANRLDNSSENVGDLYTYLWDRTRSIRKDLTQQQSCTLESVALVEKCARFHIHCAACLCEEELSRFDPKINDENLTKCLQTLKHMYYDLSIKDIYCPNEAEFMAYDVLLHLNDGDILRQVQQLRKSIRESSLVRFALQVLNALNNNNFVRFFKCVYNAPYLAGCVIHRYFSQVRIKAIYTLVKAYCPGGRYSATMQYPLDQLVNILAFEHGEECQSLCSALGLVCEDGAICLDRNNIKSTEIKTVLYRAWRVLDSKRTTSIGEVLNNGPLPSFCLENYTPHSSFDDQGYLKSGAYSADDQGLPFQTDSIQSTYPLDENKVKLEVIENICDGIINEVTAWESLTLATDVIDHFKLIDSLSLEILDDLVPPSVAELTRQCAVDVLTEEVNQQARQKKDKEDLKTLHLEVCNEIAEDMVFDMVKLVGKSTLINEINMHRRQEVYSVVECLIDALIYSLVQEDIGVIVKQCYEEAKSNVEKRALLVTRLYNSFTLRHYFNVWRQNALSCRQRKIRRKSFPPSNPTISLRQQNDLLKIGKIDKVVTSHSPHNPRFVNELLLDLSHASLDIQRLLSWTSLPLTDLIPRISEGSKPIFKFLLLLGDELEVVERDWICRLFSPSEVHDDIIYKRTTLVDKQLVSVCVRRLQRKDMANKEAFRGTTGFIVFSRTYTTSSWIKNMLLSHPELPSLMFTFGPSHEEVLNDKEVNKMVVTFEHPVPSPFNTVRVADSLAWLFNESCPPPDLVHQRLNCFLEKYLLHYVITTISESPGIYGAATTNNLTTVIRFYNAILKSLAIVVADKHLETVSWPPPEFGLVNDLPSCYWNSEENLDCIREVLLGLQLPDFHLDINISWESLCDAIWQYYELLTNNSPCITLKSRIEQAVFKYRRTLMVSKAKNYDWAYFWSLLIQAFIDYKFQGIPPLLQVFYFEEDLSNLELPALNDLNDEETCIMYETIRYVLENQESLEDRKLNITVSELPNVSMSINGSGEFDEDVKNKLDHYNSAIYCEKEKSKQFTEYIKQLLQEGVNFGVPGNYDLKNIRKKVLVDDSINMRLDFDDSSQAEV